MVPKKISVCIILMASFFFGCTKLEEDFRGNVTAAGNNANTASLLAGIYDAMDWPFSGHLSVFPLQEVSTDAAIIPTRGGDWDDNGMWRVLHQHKWAGNTEIIRVVFNDLNGISYAATDILRYSPTTQQEAEARFIRAWVMYQLLDLFDQVPYRETGESLVLEARVRKGVEALDYIISELKWVENVLRPEPVSKANSYAAKVLLMKCYLNKAVYKNRKDPSHSTTDMDTVIQLADQVINSGRFRLSDNYFDNFSPSNADSKENIFTQNHNAGNYQGNNIVFAWWAVYHYNSVFNQLWTGLNGYTTLSDFYDKFEPQDKRRGIVYDYGNFPPNPGRRINVGFLVGPQYHQVTDELLYARNGVPLDFTREVKIIEYDSTIEVTGIRPVKYYPDFPNFFAPENDYVYFRLPDVLLMKAEAIMRGGAATDAGGYGSSPIELVNAIRTHVSRGASKLSTLSSDDLYDERGRELWWENWRRQDMIRFKKFLLPFQEKQYESDSKYLIFAIPAEQIAVNPNLKQNDGY